MDSTWGTLSILLLGVIVVVGGVLKLRLHAFLALILGALCVGALTPPANIQRFEALRLAADILHVDEATGEMRLKSKAPAGTRLSLIRRSGESGRYEPVADAEVVRVDRETDAAGKVVRENSIAVLVDAPETINVTTRDVLIAPHQLSAANAAASKNLGTRIAEGFGNTCTSIGILIAMASIIGKCLLDSGSADRVVRTAMNWFGERGAPAAFVLSGFLLGVPVFFDTVFYLMIPLGKALRMRTGRNYLLYVLTIVTGATMAHSLVPPTPGPLFVAGELNVKVGTMMLAGTVVGLFTVTVGYLYSVFASRIWDLPLRESADVTLADLEAISRRDESELPPFALALLPIILPVILIGGYTVLENFKDQVSPELMSLGATLGDKNIALILSAAIAMATLIWQKRTSFAELAESVQQALASGGVIILITAGGGAFGKVLQQTGVSGLIEDINYGGPQMLIVLAFFITTAVRTAQGSATVAMITAVGILGGLADSLPFHPVYLALAIGCGSKPFAWMNDSGFWVITKMSGMTESEGLKYITPLTALMGLAGLLALVVGVTVLPMK